MNKTAQVILCVLLACFISSCIYEIEDGPFYNDPVYTGPLHAAGESCFLSDWDGYNHVSIIKVWADPDFQHRHVAEVSPGTQVKVMEVNGTTARVMFADGSSGWVRSIHVKK